MRRWLLACSGRRWRTTSPLRSASTESDAAEFPIVKGIAIGFCAVLLVAGISGCSHGEGETSAARPLVEKSPVRQAERGGSAEESVKPARCPVGVEGCRETTGRIVYVEAVDPDGDGDAHFVVVDPQGISLPGLTAIDVRKGLRPHPLPGIGDLVSAAGPVQTGSYGQEQIHAVEVNVADR